ncbi:MAG: hypothetical protein Q7U94_02330 [Sideroxyarcus sp.]|nr:hypothetical protein [Sideroxyarcus sp.]
MNVAYDQGASPQSGGAERRTNHHLRELFDQAYHVASPLLDSNLSSATHFLRITLHDAFPKLHQQDIAILCVAVERVHRERVKAGTQ